MPLRILCAALLITLGACGTTQPPPAANATLYTRLGGRDAIVAVVDDAVDNIAADARINQRFSAAGIPALKSNLVDLLCMRSGGPCVYKGRNMSDVHERMFIRDDEFDALIEDIEKSLVKFKVPPREQNETLGALRQMRNAVVGH